MLALAAGTATAGPAEELRLRALLTVPAGRGEPGVGPGLRGEARVIVHADGKARLDLVSWALPAGPAEAVLRFDAPDAGEAAAPLLVVPLERDADEGRVIGADFRLDAAATRRLRAGEGRIVLTSKQRPDTVVRGSLRLQRVPPGQRRAAD
jgi:hypothetical protein